MNLGEKIKMLRLQQGLTLEEVGNRVGVGKSTVRKWESGQIANMRRDKIALLAKALNTTPSYLMGWDEGGSVKEEAHDPVMAEREALRRDPDRRVLLDLAERGTDADVKQVRAIIDALRATNPDFYDGDDPA